MRARLRRCLRPRAVCAELEALYRGREELRWQAARFAEQKPEIFDADAMMEAAERAFLSPLDRLAEQNIEAAARQVTTLTALMPLALVDVIATLITNLRMIRKIAEIYGGRSGFFGSWRLTRLVLAHVIATGPWPLVMISSARLQAGLFWPNFPENSAKE